MENLGISFHDPDSWTPDEIIPESIKERVRMEREARAQSRGDLPYDGVSVTMTPAQMNGTRRVALDGVISEEDCQGLLIMAQMAEGSGFKARRSSHTPHERMQSLSVLQSLKLAALGAVDPSHAQLYYHASERSRVLAQSYFGTPRLHFSYAQLVCRSAIEGTSIIICVVKQFFFIAHLCVGMCE
ncbi:prolyl 3-hydroxylase 3 [Bombina bombina]|uniref:prolyl 3-hydroxylase 3 n=1 Tax=Bombina bombina TaxID=8345 RepID=UPI00235AAB9E|nr:prolyl 3-hydroxylase 3 [Bombina bombina]